MVTHVLFGTAAKLLRHNIVAKQTVKPLIVYHHAQYSNNPTKPIKEPIEKLKQKRSWKMFTVVLPLLSSCIGISLVVILGSPEVDGDGKLVKDDLTDEPTMKQYVIRTFREMEFYMKLLQKPQTEKLLPDRLEHPYNQPKYTLVIELTGVLVHPEWTYSVGWKYKKRPLLDHFLEVLKDSYEIVLYTTEQGKTVFSLMDVIDPKNIIAYKLVRGTTRFAGFSHVKELNSLNRDLKKVICIDWKAKRVRSNPENLLKVKRWTGRDDDTALLDLATFLKTITDSQIDDVREVLRYYSKYNDPVEAFRKKQEMLIEELDEAAKRGNSQRTQSGFKLFS